MSKILDIGQTNGWQMHYKNRSQENILRKKRTSRAPNLNSYHDKNKERYHKKIHAKCCKSTKNPQLEVWFWLLKWRGLSWPAGLFLKFNYTKMIHNTYPCYSSNDQKNALLSNATPIGAHKMQSADCTQAVLDCHFSTQLDQQIFLHSWWESIKNFPGATSVISRPATCQVAIAGEHFFAAKLVRGVEVVLCWNCCLAIVLKKLRSVY